MLAELSWFMLGVAKAQPTAALVALCWSALVALAVTVTIGRRTTTAQLLAGLVLAAVALVDILAQAELVEAQLVTVVRDLVVALAAAVVVRFLTITYLAVAATSNTFLAQAVLVAVLACMAKAVAALVALNQFTYQAQHTRLLQVVALALLVAQAQMLVVAQLAHPVPAVLMAAVLLFLVARIERLILVDIQPSQVAAVLALKAQLELFALCGQPTQPSLEPSLLPM